MTTFGDRLYQLGGMPVGIGTEGYGGMGGALPQETRFVDSNNGSDGNDGMTMNTAYATIQQAVDVLNVAVNITKDCDIHVMGGVYAETVRLIRSHMSSTELLWTAGGQNVGYVGKLRVIGHGVVFLNGGTAATVPTIQIERPNVEFHDFEMIYMTTEVTVTSGNWTLSNGGSVSGFGMPCVYMGDDYNNDDLLMAAANTVLFKNCRINGGNVTGGNTIINHGGKHCHLVNCIIEYGATYGAAWIGSSKGAGSENHIVNCLFSQNGTDIYQQAQILL